VRLSVVIPFFNAAGTLPRCLDAIALQRYPPDDFEVIAVDNNSTDGSPELARRRFDGAAAPRTEPRLG
jgi:glycosyltransferase involved in cell wall biosynthesis